MDCVRMRSAQALARGGSQNPWKTTAFWDMRLPLHVEIAKAEDFALLHALTYDFALARIAAWLQFPTSGCWPGGNPEPEVSRRERIIRVAKDFHDTHQTCGAPWVAHAERSVKAMTFAASNLMPGWMRRHWNQRVSVKDWITDVPHLRIDEGWLRLRAVRDASSHRVLGWECGCWDSTMSKSF